MDDKRGRAKLGQDTLAVRGGEDLHPLNASQTPVFETTAFRFSSIQEMVEMAKGERTQYLYSRYANPTVQVAERKIAALEGGEAALVFGSGMAAIACATLPFLRSGDRLLAASSLYGGTLHLLNDVFPRFGIGADYFEVDSQAQISERITPATRLILAESPTNPALRLLDLETTARLARSRGVLTALDSTFATPANQRPLELGWDIVVHSATKYLGGHSDVTAGVAVSRPELIAEMDVFRRFLGTILDPLPAYLLIRGMKSLKLRVERQNSSALELARALQSNPQIEKVNYPFLESHPQHDLAVRQMKGGGGVLSFAVRGGWEATRRFFDSLKIIPISTSLGGVDSLVTSPFWTSHYGMSERELASAGVTENLVRMAVGIEALEDLKADLEQALLAAGRG